eukprot:43347-Eustigmatos_ZCMA.PRE.1
MIAVSLRAARLFQAISLNAPTVLSQGFNPDDHIMIDGATARSTGAHSLYNHEPYILLNLTRCSTRLFQLHSALPTLTTLHDYTHIPPTVQ